MPRRSIALEVLRPAFMALAPLALMALVAPWLSLDARSATLLSLVAVSASIVGSMAVASPVPPSARVGVGVALAGVALVALALRLPPVASGLAGSLGLLAVAWVVGSTIGSRMESAGHLAAVALVSSAVDLWSVTSPSGPTHRIVQSPAMVRLLTVSVAIAPSREPRPAIGVGDAVFAALYLAAAARFAMPRARMTWALAAGMFGAGVLAMGLERAVPALPTMGLMVLVTQPAARKVPEGDRRATALAAVLLLASIARAVTR